MVAMPDTVPTFWLLAAAIAFLLKHLAADFLLQTDWMARGKEAERGWLAPLTAHVAVHAAITALIFTVAAPALVWLAAVDFGVHFFIDRMKGIIGRKLTLAPSSSGFWWLMGIDQTLHHATHLVFVVALAAAKAA